MDEWPFIFAMDSGVDPSFIARSTSAPLSSGASGRTYHVASDQPNDFERLSCTHADRRDLGRVRHNSLVKVTFASVIVP